MIGLLKQANRPMARCASEGAFDVAEELLIEQRLSYGC